MPPDPADARGLSQKKLAVDARVATPYLSGIERAAVNPTVDVLELNRRP